MDTEFTQKQVGENALAKLNALADELNEREPSLTIDQCFSKVYQDPKNRDLVARERFGNGFVKAMPSSLEVVGVEKAMPVVESLDPIEERDMALGKLKEMAAKFRENHPELTAEQAFSKVYLMNPDLQKAERRASRRALGIAEDAIRAMTR